MAYLKIAVADILNTYTNNFMVLFNLFFIYYLYKKRIIKIIIFQLKKANLLHLWCYCLFY